MSEINVKAGDTVEQGVIIGKAGNSGASTAPHLHFELHKDGKAVNPALYIKVSG
jgi:murein DD-endopeptidase MepM/ murein hydrolase activator NlpD